MVLKHWLSTLVKEYVIDKGVLPENTYRMDKAGFPPADQGWSKVISWKGTKVQHKSGGAGHENITVIVTICVDGTAEHPGLIY